MSNTCIDFKQNPVVKWTSFDPIARNRQHCPHSVHTDTGITLEQKQKIARCLLREIIKDFVHFIPFNIKWTVLVMQTYSTNSGQIFKSSQCT